MLSTASKLLMARASPLLVETASVSTRRFTSVSAVVRAPAVRRLGRVSSQSNAATADAMIRMTESERVERDLVEDGSRDMADLGTAERVQSENQAAGKTMTPDAPLPPQSAERAATGSRTTTGRSSSSPQTPASTDADDAAPRKEVRQGDQLPSPLEVELRSRGHTPDRAPDYLSS